MLVCATWLLTSKTILEPDEAKNVTSLTCYGLSMCTCHPLVLLKLSVDFESQTLNCSEVLLNMNLLFMVDQAISYIFHRLML